jgi:predicted DNA-binding protein with PD1-like motif
MRAKELAHDGTRRWILVFETGDEAMELLTEFADRCVLLAASFTGIGASTPARGGPSKPD